jgi:hypothetical protein
MIDVIARFMRAIQFVSRKLDGPPIFQSKEGRAMSINT